MSRFRCALLKWHRVAGVLGLGLAFGGCATPPAPDRPQWIAMTQLAPAGVDAAASWFPRAVSLTLRNELGLMPGLMVIVPPVSATGATEVPEVVGWFVEGAVSREGGRTRFDITLRRKAEASPSWQRRFEYAADGDASQWRKDIPAAVAAQLGVAPKAVGAGDLGACRSTAAAEYTLRAIEAYGNYRTRDDLMSVRGWLEQALQQEPGCVEARAQHVMTHASELGNRWSTDPKAQMELADRLSRQAVAESPLQPFTHLARLQVLRLQRQIDAALEEATTLTRLDPSNSLFMGRLAALQYDVGDAPAALTTARKIQSLPSGTLAALQQGLLYEGMAHFSMGEEQQSAAVLRRLAALNPQSSFPWLMLASIEALHGHESEATAALQRYLALSPPGQSIRRLRANETTVPEGKFKQQRERYYVGLRRAGLSE
jgi:tetratricopeptide (TPR) repeat protein